MNYLKIVNGTKVWRNKADQLHREDGPAIEWASGSKFYFINDKLHRENCPAIEYADGTKKYYIHDKLHRENGPAIEWASGSKKYYINNRLLTPEQYKDYVSRKQTISTV